MDVSTVLGWLFLFIVLLLIGLAYLDNYRIHSHMKKNSPLPEEYYITQIRSYSIDEENSVYCHVFEKFFNDLKLTSYSKLSTDDREIYMLLLEELRSITLSDQIIYAYLGQYTFKNNIKEFFK